MQSNDVLGPFGRKKLREIAQIADQLAYSLDVVRDGEQRQQRHLQELQDEDRKLPLRLEALHRESPKKTEAELKAFNEQEATIKGEIVRNETAISEARAELQRLKVSGSRPRDDRKAVLKFIDVMVKHSGDEGARLRATMAGRIGGEVIGGRAA